MTEPSTRLKQALAQVEAPWDSARTERTQRTLRSRRRSAQLRSLLTGLVAVATIGGATWQLAEQGPWQISGEAAKRASEGATRAAVVESPSSREQVVAAEAAQHSGGGVSRPRQLELADGSSITLLDPSTRITVEQSSEQLIVANLQGGAARFHVTQGLSRTFRVHSQQLVVEVLGTVFELAPRGAQTRVQVDHGRVAVSWADQRRVLTDGEEGLFPPAAEARVSAREPRAGASHEQPTQDLRAAASRSVLRPARGRIAHDVLADSWRDHAERGDFKRAFPLLPGTDNVEQMAVAELLLAADAARLSGHPRAALPFLERVVEAHPDDPRAPLAAFTLGGVLMNQLGLPREAEAAYRKARTSTHSTALTQDALARQVEAAHRAGDDVLARKLAREYLEQYPEGRRLQAVRRFGGL